LSGTDALCGLLIVLALIAFGAGHWVLGAFLLLGGINAGGRDQSPRGHT